MTNTITGRTIKAFKTRHENKQQEISSKAVYPS